MLVIIYFFQCHLLAFTRFLPTKSSIPSSGGGQTDSQKLNIHHAKRFGEITTIGTVKIDGKSGVGWYF